MDHDEYLGEIHLRPKGRSLLSHRDKSIITEINTVTSQIEQLEEKRSALRETLYKLRKPSGKNT